MRTWDIGKWPTLSLRFLSRFELVNGFRAKEHWSREDTSLVLHSIQ